MKVILVGPGRAGMSLGIALTEAGHRIVGVVARSEATGSAERLGTEVLGPDSPLPPADLVVVAVGDEAIAEVAGSVARRVTHVGGAVHLSGAVPVSALHPFAARGIGVGAFHPLQSLPDPDRGAQALAGSAVAITTTDPDLHERLQGLASDLAMTWFDLGDDHRALYHAAASVASNAVVAALWLADRLFEAASVDPELALPMVEKVVSHSFGGGAAAAITGPVARGDMATVTAQIDAVRSADPEVLDEFLAALRLIAGAAGRREEIAEVIS